MIFGPILARELRTTPRRVRHYVARGGYAALLFVLLWTTWQSVVGFQRVTRLGDLAHFGGLVFQVFSFTQLTLLLFAAMMQGASSLSQEKDRRTFVLLLVTRLSDAEIVFGKFFASLIEVLVALVVSLPVFLTVLLLGGVGLSQVAQVFAATLGACLVGAATGVLMGTWREKTFQAIALTLLVVTIALIAIEAAALLGGERTIAGVPVDRWLACLSPYRALARVGDDGFADAGWLVARAGWVNLALSSGSALLLLVFATVGLRAWNPRGEPVPQAEEAVLGPKGTSPRKTSREIWSNPVLWREIRTRAYGTRPILVKLGYLVIFGLLVAGLVAARPAPEDPNLRLVVARLVLPAAILSLLLINAQAVTAITSERDLKGLDLLLVTDVSPGEFIHGKLLGILYNTKEVILPPIAALIGCAQARYLGPAALAYGTLTFLVFVLFASVLGIHAGMRYESTRAALANSLGTMFLLFVGILLCLFLILISGRFEAQWASFILFIVVGSIALWVSLGANAPSSAIGLTAAITPFATFYCIIAFLNGDKTGPFLVGAGTYGFAVLALLVPLVSEFDVATGRTTAGEG